MRFQDHALSGRPVYPINGTDFGRRASFQFWFRRHLRRPYIVLGADATPDRTFMQVAGHG